MGLQTQAAAARDAGIDKVEAGASEAFMAAAFAAISDLAGQDREFIIDDVWTMRRDWPETRDKRAMGGAMRQARAAGLIEPTDVFRSSAQVRCHANPRRVWRSLVWGAR